MNCVLYLYGFVSDDAAPVPETLKGIDGQGVHLLDFGSVAAAVSEVDEERYGEAGIEHRLKDLQWVARQGADHETVVTWLTDHATIVPARMLTIFSSEQSLARAVDARRGAIETQIRRFEDLREWDLKIHYDVDVFVDRLGEVSEDVARMDAEIANAAPGRRYLLERKRQGVAKSEAASAARKLAATLLDELAGFAEDVIEVELPARREGLPVVLNAALLVSRDRAAALQQRASELTSTLGARGVHAELTGPWAPYRFVERGGEGE